MILYAMLYGKYPFDAKEARFARKIVTADYTLLPASLLYPLSFLGDCFPGCKRAGGPEIAPSG